MQNLRTKPMQSPPLNSCFIFYFSGTNRFSVDQVKTEFNQVKNTVKKLQSQMSNNPDAEITEQFGEFLEVSKIQC